MGEAKRKLEAVRAEFLAELDRWSFLPNDWEATTVAEIKLLPVVKVTRGRDVELEWMRMKPRQCHANARFMEEKDPEQRSKQITGWWPQDGNYVLHSIVDQYGQLVCVTPAPLHRENPFAFIPDPKIEWREVGDYREAYRDGVKIGPGVRINPAGTLAEIDIIRRRLLSGMNPYKAVQRDQPSTL
ncbi:conserved hypothetical protein [Roseovarius sp. EC-HK134]|uniref:hypothetical protein n=1 Tax=unclassified Roseovarius TaxID=2614913 RepID=UPI00125A3908|nr:MULTISPECIES: hypothetical protein [unclassified Roseovarius]VVT23209.1 conserved hypothetical protein [Roseovarius sp. EC-SD190]VVT23408.1 conserved hypothetical protein [Roseovarius sp. EC-HK134]